jgi:hypothetical protein
MLYKIGTNETASKEEEEFGSKKCDKNKGNSASSQVVI